MQNAFDDQMNKMKELLLIDRMPRAVVNGFISMVYHAAHCDPPYYIESPFVQTAFQPQEILGLEAILQGFHYMQWVETI